MPKLAEKNLSGLMIFIGVASSAQQFLMAKSHQHLCHCFSPVHYTAVPKSDPAGILFFNR